MEVQFLKLSKKKEISKNWKTTYLINILFVCFYFFFTHSGLAQFDGKPIIITPKDRTIVQRCFIEGEENKRTFCVAVGDPEQIHYAMDLSQGTIINLWRGDFFDATTMWTGRGVEQLAHPLGEKVIKLSSEPSFAFLQNKKEAWPVEQTPGNYKFKGYSLDDYGRPTFKYKLNEATIEDKTTPENHSQNLTRTVTLNDKNNQNKLWIRLANGKNIDHIKKGLYGIDDKSYYINVTSKKKQKPLIRKVEGGMELLVPILITSGQGQVKYSIIW